MRSVRDSNLAFRPMSGSVLEFYVASPAESKSADVNVLSLRKPVSILRDLCHSRSSSSFQRLNFYSPSCYTYVPHFSMSDFALMTDASANVVDLSQHASVPISKQHEARGKFETYSQRTN